jgi:AAA+ ATPase superfamily predicted ATPase
MDNVQRREIPSNPYIVGNPIKSRDMFFGREDDFQFVARKIGEGRSNQIAVLCGERRSGKTSILFQILGGRLGGSFLPILIDMQMLAGIKGDREFFSAILKAGCAALADPGLSLERLGSESGATVERMFESFLEITRAGAPERIVLFLLDEYELIEAKIRDGSLSEAAVHYLAGILESPFRVSFVFTGSTNLEDRKVEVWKSLLGKSIYRKISYLSEKDTKRLIAEPLKEWISWPAEVAASIYRLTGGQPFYTQVVCQNMVDLLIEERRADPTPADLERIVRDIVDNPLPQMIYSWNSLGEWEQIILSSLASQLAGPEDWSGSAEIAAFIRGNRIVLPFARERINVLLEEAYHAEFLEKSEEASYRFRMDLFRGWIRREHSIWKVAKEARLAFRKSARPFVIVGAAVLALAVLVTLGWYLLIPRGAQAEAGQAGAAGPASEKASSAEGALVTGVTFSADRGPFQATIDGEITVTSEGREDTRSIAAPALSKGAHIVDFKASTGERVRRRIEVAAGGERFAVVFPPPRAASGAATGTETGTTGVAETGPPVDVAVDAAGQGTEPSGQAGQAQPAPEALAPEAPAVGVLIINTQPPGARIELDGRLLAQPTPFAESVPAGEHTILLSLEGYAPAQLSVSVEKGGQAKTDTALIEAWAELGFDVRPTAKISLDGAHILDTPYAKPYAVRAGRHMLTIENEALGVKKSIEIDLREGEKRLIQEVLK